MFWEHPDWKQVPEPELRAAIELVRSGATSEPAFFLTEEEAKEDLRVDSLVIGSVRVRELTFLPDHWLYELQVSLDERGPRARYASARAYAIVAPARNPAPGSRPESEAVAPPHRRMDRVLRGGPVTLVNWQAGTIFEVLERAQMQLDQAGEFDLARTIEYLDFFVSFTASETGQPLLLLRGGTLDDPEGLERRGTIPFEAVISSRRLARDPEFLCRPDDPDVTSSQEPVEQTGLKPPVPVGDDGRIPDVAVDPSGAKDPRSLRLTGTGLFEDTCFRVTFEVRSQDKFATDVKIIDNTPLKRLDEGLSQYRVDRVSKTGPRLLLLNKAREEVPAGNLISRLRGGRAGDGSSLPLENLRVWGDVDLSDVALADRIELLDVEFLGRVLLDDCQRTASLAFKRCKFAKSIQARNLGVTGDLVLDHSSVFGATKPGDTLGPSILLDGARISGSLLARDLKLDGHLSACNAQIKGRLDLRGVDGLMREGETQGLLLRNALVEAGVDLSPFEKEYLPGSRRRTRSCLQGLVDLRGIVAAEIDLRGAMFDKLDLSYARIAGLLDMQTVAADPLTEDQVGARLFRTKIEMYLDAGNANAREIFVSGARVGRYLGFQGITVGGSVFARPQYLAGYRTWVGGDVYLSTARIGGDCDFDGAKVQGAFEIRTGSIGRLKLSLHPVLVRGKRAVELDFFRAEVGSLEVSAVTDLRAVRLAGISVRGRPDGLSPLVFEHVHVQGDIYFSWSKNEDDMFEPIWWRDVARKAAQELELAQELVVRREASPGTCGATVNGSVEMRRITTSGHVDLTNVEVGGHLHMADARIGTDLLAHSVWRQDTRFLKVGTAAPTRAANGRLAFSCIALNLEGAHVDGNAILSGLELRREDAGTGRLNGRGMCVGGALELFFNGRYAQLPGGLDLTGAKAAHLTISNSSFSGPGGAVLQRAEFGKLDVKDPIPRLDLTGTSVTQWELGEGGDDVRRLKRQIDILKRMDPIDRTVWIAVETQLRNETRSDAADRVYREMKNTEWVKMPRWRRVFAALSWLLFGYGTRVWPALVISALLSLFLLAALRNAANVKASDGLLGQINTQCGVLTGKHVALPPICQKYDEAAASRASTLQVSARELEDDYGLADAVPLTIRYSIPLIGAFGEPAWLPMEKSRAEGLVIPVPFSPSTLATVVLIVNTVLLSFTAAFVTKRWLR